MTIRQFQKLIWEYYKSHKRDLPWRRTADPYRILVSEVMLQQTQVPRVIHAYRSFLKLFPSVRALARAPLADVLRAWQGLGYYRRAKMLKAAAEMIVEDFKGQVPKNPDLLDELPGIGANTAGSVAVYAFNLPVVFIETNIRKIYIHHFFEDRENVSDAEILPLIEKTLDRKNPRQWYWALMDYGLHLSKTIENPNRRSSHYARQSKYEGSFRQLRAQVLHLAAEGSVDTRQIVKNTGRKKAEAQKALQALVAEGFLARVKNKFKLA